MYYLKINGLDKGRVYILALVGHMLHLKLPIVSQDGKTNTSTSLEIFRVVVQSFESVPYGITISTSPNLVSAS